MRQHPSLGCSLEISHSLARVCESVKGSIEAGIWTLHSKTKGTSMIWTSSGRLRLNSTVDKAEMNEILWCP
jgi:hypothetical protein